MQYSENIPAKREEVVSMTLIGNGEVLARVGNISRVFADYVQAAAWAESMMYSEVMSNG